MSKPVVLKNMDFQPSEDGSWHRIYFGDDEGGEVAVALPTDQLRTVALQLMKYVTALEAQGALAALPADGAGQTLPATESAILYAKQMDLVRSQEGTALLRASTTEGLSIHLALEPAHQQYLRETLAR